MNKNPILVTGIHRSGSTFAGKMLTLNNEVGYIQEPFNKVYGLTVFDKYFQYITEKTADQRIKTTLDDLTNLRKATYNISSEAVFDKSLADRRELFKEMIQNISTKNFLDYTGKLLFRSKAQLQFYRAKFNPLVKRILLKDPIACLSSQYLHRTYNMDVIILVRHPLSFIGSIKRLNWKFDFKNFLDQEELMEDYLGQFRRDMEILNKDSSGSVVEQGCLLWNCIYKVLSDYADNNPAFIICKHEEIAADPIYYFKMLYQKLDLNFNQRVEQTIKDHTSKENFVAVKDNKVHQLKRDSSQVPEQWKSILNEQEISYVKEKTESIASLFYS